MKALDIAAKYRK